MPSSNDLRIGQLLCTRLCHDLSGPIGALVAGLDMASELDRREDILPLLIDTSHDLMRRFAFYRLAFGLRGGDHGTATLREAEALARDLTYGTRHHFDGQFDGADPERARPAVEVRLLLCLILVGIGSAPRGGLVRATAAASTNGHAHARNVSFDLEVAGDGARLEPAIRTILTAKPGPAAIDARTVHAALAARLAAGLGAVVVIAPAPAGVVRIGVEPRPCEHLPAPSPRKRASI